MDKSRDEILNSEKSADELAEEMMSKFDNGGYKENGEKDEDKDKDEGDINEEPEDIDPPAENNNDDDTDDDDDAGIGNEDEIIQEPEANDGSEETNNVAQEEQDAFDLFSEINKLNNPDNLDVPKGMVPYRENKQTKFITPDEYNKRFHMGSHFTKKMQKHKKQIAIAEKFEKAGITDEDIQILAALKSGKVEDAMKGIGKQYSLDSEKLSRGVVDIEDQHIQEYSFNENTSNYVPTENVKNYFDGMPTEYYNKYNEMADNIPTPIRKIIDSNDGLITGFASDVASGKAEQILDHVYASVSHLSEFEQQIILTNPESFFNLYGEGERSLLGNSNTRAEETQSHQATPIPGSQINSSEAAARARLNQKQTVRKNKPQNKNDRKDHTSRIMNEDGYVDKYIKEKYGF